MNKIQDILIITLGKRGQLGGGRIRVYDFATFVEKNHLYDDLRIKILIKPMMLKVNLLTLLRHFVSLIGFYIKLVFTLRKKWSVIECYHVFFPKWLARIVSHRTCLILDFNDFGLFDEQYMRSKWCQQPKILGMLNKWKWTQERKNMLAMCQYTTIAMSCSGETLPPFLLQFKDKFFTLTDPIDVELYTPQEEKEPLVIGWTGSQSTAYLVNSIKTVLVKLKKKYGTQIEIRLFGSDDLTPFDSEICEVSTIVPWSLEHQIIEIGKIKIGLVPAFDDALTRYKQPYKIMQHNAAGAPIIANPIGMVPSLIKEQETGFLARTEDEWLKYLCLLIEDEELRKRMSVAARAEAVERFSYEAYAKRWYSLVTKDHKLCGVS